MPIQDREYAKQWQREYRQAHVAHGLCNLCTEPFFKSGLCDYHYGYRRGIQDRYRRRKLLERGGIPRGHYRKHGLYNEKPLQSMNLEVQADQLVMNVQAELRLVHAKLTAELQGIYQLMTRIPSLKKDIESLERTIAILAPTSVAEKTEQESRQEDEVPLQPKEATPLVSQTLPSKETKELGAPRCPKCTGLVTQELCFDMAENAQAVMLLRCINCGWRNDPVINQNQDKTIDEKVAILPRRGRKPRQPKAVNA